MRFLKLNQLIPTSGFVQIDFFLHLTSIMCSGPHWESGPARGNIKSALYSVYCEFTYSPKKTTIARALNPPKTQ